MKTMGLGKYCAAFWLCLSVMATGQVSGEVRGETYTVGSPEHEVWSLEQAIYRERAKGNRAHYPGLTNEHYLGWPAPAAVPLPQSSLLQFRQSGSFPKGEKLDVWSNGVSIDGDTAISYFSTHRTQLAGGEPVDQRYENIHVWVRRDAGWELIGSFSRKLTDEDALRTLGLAGDTE